MESIEFKVENVVVPIETIMVHFQGGDSPEARPFTLVVPSGYVKEVFDPYGSRPHEMALDGYVMALVSEMGTFIMGGYLDAIRRFQKKELGAFRWVVATVEEVTETNVGMLVRGKVVPFIPWSGVAFEGD